MNSPSEIRLGPDFLDQLTKSAMSHGLPEPAAKASAIFGVTKAVAALLEQLEEEHPAEGASTREGVARLLGFSAPL